MIKFRAWDKERKIYLYNVQDAYDAISGFVQYDDGKYADYDKCCFGDFLDDKRYDVEQFINMRDMNSRDIYIGDVVKVWSDMSELKMDPIVSEVVSEDLFGRPGVFLKPAGLHLIDPCLHDSWSSQFEVIGNVHENRELLEADK